MPSSEFKRGAGVRVANCLYFGRAESFNSGHGCIKEI